MKQSNSGDEHKGPLLHAVANFLDANGFSKTLQHFLSEAPLDANEMKESSLDLEEMYCKYSHMCNKENTNDGGQKHNGNDPVHEEVAKSKDKNKETKQVNIFSDIPDGAEQRNPEPLSRSTEESLKDISDSEKEKKFEDKEKNKNSSNDANQTSKKIADGNLLYGNPRVKNNQKESSGGEDKNIVALKNAIDIVMEEGFKITDVDATVDENKSSKKRMRLDYEDNVSELGKSKEDEIAVRSSIQTSIKKQCNGSTQYGAEISYGGKPQEILGQDSGGIWWKFMMQNEERRIRRNRQRHLMMMAACAHILDMQEEESDSDESDSDESA